MPDTILLVDDEDMILDSLSAILVNEGYQVDCAHDGNEALDILKQKQYDLVITDIRMPGMDGMEMVERLRSIAPRPKIMVITGYGSLDTAVKAQHRGVCDYMIKPIDIQGLKTSIHRALYPEEKVNVSETKPLENKLRDSIEYVSLLSEFTDSLNASLDVGEIMDITLDRLKKIAETDVASLFLFSPVVCELYYLKNIDEMPVLSAGKGISASLGEAARSMTGPVLVSASDEEAPGTGEGSAQSLIRQAMAGDKIRHTIVMPIVVKDRVIGLADVCVFRDQSFSDVDLQIIKTLVNQAALALAKALSYLEMEERSKEISYLYNMSLRLNQSLKINDSIKVICEGAVDITGAAGSLLQTSLEPGSIKNFIYHKDLGFHKEMKRGSQNWLIPQTARKEAFFSNDPLMDSRVNSLALYSLGIRSLAYVPLIYEWEDLGGLTVFYKTEDKTFDERDLNLLHLYARHASEVLLNSQLFEAIKKSRESIISEKNKMDIVLRNMADGVVTIARDGRITYINDAMQRMLGVREEDAVGTVCREVFSRERCRADCPIMSDELPAVQQSFETELKDGDNASMPAYVTLTPIKDSEGNTDGWVKVVKNIDHIKKLEQIKDTFFHTLAHDLRAPLSSLMGFIELLGQRNYTPEKQKGYLKIMQDSASDMDAIINNLMDVHRSRTTGISVKPTDVDMNDLMQSTLQEMDGMARNKDVSLSRSEAGNALTARVDSSLIKRVLNNLLSNAIKYTPDGGSVRLSAKQVSNGRGAAGATPRDGAKHGAKHGADTGAEGTADAPFIEISIEDNGAGIPGEDIARVFDQFYQVSRAGDSGTVGTGLGLAITKEIIEAHGGTIWAECIQGGGTKFTFTLPLGNMHPLQ